MFLIFGLLLVWTAVRLYRHRDRDPDIGNNPLVRSSSRILPVGDTYIGGRLIARVHGRRVVTPLFVVFITIGGTDILFELDSIPAVFGVTDQAYIVFAANAFALLGLRALFFLVTGLLDRLVYLSSGLALILAFTGVKLILHWGHGNLSTEATIRNENPPTGTETRRPTETVDPVCCAWPATWPSPSTCCSPTLSCPACSATRSPPRSARCPRPAHPVHVRLHPAHPRHPGRSRPAHQLLETPFTEPALLTRVRQALDNSPQPDAK